jgi:hypothetical protein
MKFKSDAKAKLSFLALLQKFRNICELSKENCDQTRAEIKELKELNVAGFVNMAKYIDECSKKRAEICG